MAIFITAEIGINHNGDMDICKNLIDVAADAGCNAVKFQKRDIDEVYTQEFLNSARESPWGTTQRAQKEGLEFDESQYKEIDQYCKDKKIDWFLLHGIQIVKNFYVNLTVSITRLRQQCWFISSFWNLLRTKKDILSFLLV